ncbi:MAG: PKD domain-containing protein [Thermodesulfobacteriota bacterium]|nr:PKD domain-containing protein [Thermodesulfobacteriota bacterium]
MVCRRNIIKTILICSFVLLTSAFSSNLFAEELNANINNVFLKIISSVNKQEIFNLEKNYAPSASFSGESFQPAASSPSTYVQSYFPLNNNDVKYYEGDVAGTTYYATYRYSQVDYNGNICFLEYDSLDGSKGYYGHSGSNLNMYGVSIEGESYPFDSPLTILNDSILNDGGSLQSSTTFSAEGYSIDVNLTVNSQNIGSVSIPLGSVDNCRSIEMIFNFSVQGESETFDMKEVWILAPNIGKLRIALMDQFFNDRGWLDLTGGTVGGQDIVDIITPIIANFKADLFGGFSPLTVQFTDLSSGSINSWYWDFGDGTNSFNSNPQHVFSSPGAYTVSLTVTGPNGSDAESKADCINVKEMKAMPWIPNLLLDD